MIRFLMTAMMLLVAGHLRAEVLVANFDFTNSTDRAKFTSSNATAGASWVGSNTTGWTIQGNNSNANGTAYISLINPVRFDANYDAKFIVNHFYSFADTLDGGRLAYSTDGNTWNYATSFNQGGYDGNVTAWSNGQAWTGSSGPQQDGSPITSVFQFTPISSTTDYYVRMEAKFSNAIPYGVATPVWGISSIQAVTVPEPGTMILGGIAALSGGAGVWWKRRRKSAAPPEEETPGQSTTVL